MEAEIKTDLDPKALPQFKFKTDLPMQSLIITDLLPDSEEKSTSRIVEFKESDGRANDGRKRVRLIASSDATDLVGDVMSKNALNQMKNTAVGTTIFLNHNTTIPEDVFGSVEKAELTKKTVTISDGGETKDINIICLEYDVVVEETSERAINVWKMIDAGTTKLGASVTIAILERRSLSDGRRCIDDVIYLETSIVGIPCNQTAWVQYVKSCSFVQQAKKALREIDKYASKAIEAPTLQASTSETLNVDELMDKPASPAVLINTSIGVIPLTALEGKATPKPTTSSKTERTGMKIANSKTIVEAVTAFKDMFSDQVEDHFENPWLYTYLLEDALIELIYFNSSMPTDEKLAAWAEMADAFKSKMGEVLKAYWTDDDDSKAFQDQFNLAAAKHMQIAMKLGNRNNKEDQKTLDSCHDALVSLGAACSTGDEKAASGETGTDATDEVKSAKALEEANATIEELKASKQKLEEEKTELEKEKKELIKEKKNLNLEISKWKAGALSATAMLEAVTDVPAPRPDQSVN